ncbi:DUF2188 domain-containing protein [Actinacidiphila sp. bgisy160]|uniref:DUF2188 domain-containing protein n=1 Tax=Actinacidiphila sp. bgisy160 TaxID=3413796 RepID=UPI003D723CFF
MRVSSRWGSREPLNFTPIRPDLVAEFHGDAAVDQGRWRHPVRVHRLRGDLSPSDVPTRSMTPPRHAGAQSPPGGGDMTKQPKRTVYHVTPADNPASEQKWQVEHKEGRRELREPHTTQRQAIDAAREQAKQHQPAQVVVHGRPRNGGIRTEYTYGNDPRRPPAHYLQNNQQPVGQAGPVRPRRALGAVAAASTAQVESYRADRRRGPHRPRRRAARSHRAASRRYSPVDPLLPRGDLAGLRARSMVGQERLRRPPFPSSCP